MVRVVRVVLLTCPSLLVHRPLHRCKVVLHAGIVGVDLQSLLIRVISAEKVALSKEGGPLAPPALGPVGLQLCGLLGILEGVVPVLLRGMCGRSVAVEDVVGWVDGNSLCKLVTGVVLSATGEGLELREPAHLHGLVKVLRGNGLVAKSFELVRGRHLGCAVEVLGGFGVTEISNGAILSMGVFVEYFLLAGERGTRSQGWSLNSSATVVAAQPMESFDVFRWLSDVLIGAS